MKYVFKKVSTVEDILKEIGATNIPSTEVIMRRPAEDGSELEIDFGAHTLNTAQETALLNLLERLEGVKLKQKK
jgi:uncharacterized protein with von Willebrand factor type A (vWA) domain